MSAKDLQDEVGYWVRERERWFEVMENGRVRCKLNGHEMVPCLEALNAFVDGKKFKRLQQRALCIEHVQNRELHFVPSKNFEDKMYCTVTGQLVEMREAACRNHVQGKKYQKAYRQLLSNPLSCNDLKSEPEISEIMRDLAGEEMEMEAGDNMQSEMHADTEHGVDLEDSMDTDPPHVHNLLEHMQSLSLPQRPQGGTNRQKHTQRKGPKRKHQ